MYYDEFEVEEWRVTIDVASEDLAKYLGDAIKSDPYFLEISKKDRPQLSTLVSPTVSGGACLWFLGGYKTLRAVYEFLKSFDEPWVSDARMWHTE